MSKTNNEVLLDALVKFQRWCDAGGHNLVAENNFIRSQLAAERGLREAAEARAAGLASAVADVISHREAWRKAIELSRDLCEPADEDTDDAGYWTHELNVFDRVASLLAHAPEQGGGGE